VWLVHPKRRFLQEPHGVTSQKTPVFNIPSCCNQDGGLRGDGLSCYSDEDISENEQQEIEKKENCKTVTHKRKGINRQKSAETAKQINIANRCESLPQALL
jgi:hypothetical protein